MNVTLEPAAEAQRGVIDNLMQLYLHDFSAFAPVGTPYGELGPEGRFAYPHLGLYWHDPGRIPLLTRADGEIAGFVLVNTWSALERPLDRSVAEFFVVRKYRRAGVGTAAAQTAFQRYLGWWEVPVAHYNAPALAFWRRATQGYAVEEVAGDGHRWSGPVLRFRTRQMMPGGT